MHDLLFATDEWSDGTMWVDEAVAADIADTAAFFSCFGSASTLDGCSIGGSRLRWGLGACRPCVAKERLRLGVMGIQDLIDPGSERSR
jgi:hypothetical protein